MRITQEADYAYALRPLSRYNLDYIIQDLDTALDQANGNMDARVRRDNLLASLLLFKQVQRAMARFINLEVEHDHDNHDNVKYDMVDNALAILGASTITSMYDICQYYSNNGISEKSKLKKSLKRMDLIADGFEKNIPASAEQALCGEGGSHLQLVTQLDKHPITILERDTVEVLQLDTNSDALFKKQTLTDALDTFTYVTAAGKKSYRRNAKAVYQCLRDQAYINIIYLYIKYYNIYYRRTFMHNCMKRGLDILLSIKKRIP